MIKYIMDYYHFDMEVDYHDNASYRNILRKLFYMKTNYNPALDEIDEETRDELTYDEDTMSAGMDKLYDFTKDDELFNELYDLAAGRMLSTDKYIGQAVLLSYDYLLLFHRCLGSFVKGIFHKDNEYYNKLKEKLT